jgi:translation elongation factor EF-1beta
MRVLKQVATITLIIVVEDEMPGQEWLRKQIEKIAGVATVRIDAFANTGVLAVKIG